MTDFSDIERWFSAERMAPYLSCCNGDREAAIQLYVWNARVSAALWQTVGHVEVLVRNAMHTSLTQWSLAQHGSPRWYLTAQRYFSPQARNAVAEARRRLQIAGKAETPGRVIAELTLAFWRHLTTARYHRHLWQPALHRAFPGRHRQAVARSLRELHLLRNRIAHHEPVHQMDLIRQWRCALELAEWVDPYAQTWIFSKDDVGWLLWTQT